MNAALDIGNTTIKIGFFDRSGLKEVHVFHDLVRAFKLLKKCCSATLIISTVRTLSNNEMEHFKSIAEIIFLDHRTRTPISLKYNTPQTLGPDRIAAVIGANKEFTGRNSLVIDCGTCITYDLINATGEYQGGSIHPGLNMKYSALHNFTSKLPLVHSKEMGNRVGKSTEECIRSGVLGGSIAEMQGMITAYRNDFNDLHVLLTGGDADFFESNLNTPIFVRPNLILEGLVAVFDHS
jgi:type III pantothenate kinase